MHIYIYIYIYTIGQEMLDCRYACVNIHTKTHLLHTFTHTRATEKSMMHSSLFSNFFLTPKNTRFLNFQWMSTAIPFVCPCTREWGWAFELVTQFCAWHTHKGTRKRTCSWTRTHTHTHTRTIHTRTNLPHPFLSPRTHANNCPQPHTNRHMHTLHLQCGPRGTSTLTHSHPTTQTNLCHRRNRGSPWQPAHIHTRTHKRTHRNTHDSV